MYIPIISLPVNIYMIERKCCGQMEPKSNSNSEEEKC